MIIKHKHSAVSNSIPDSNQLTTGELAINSADGVVYTKITTNNIVKLTSATADGGEILAPVLDAYPGAAGAYSLRQLSSIYTGPVVRLVRSHDSIERDFTADEISSGYAGRWASSSGGNAVYPSVNWGINDYRTNVIFGVVNYPTQTVGATDPFGGTNAAQVTFPDTVNRRFGTPTDSYARGFLPSLNGRVTFSFWARLVSGSNTLNTVLRSNLTNRGVTVAKVFTSDWTRHSISFTYTLADGAIGFYFDSFAARVVEFYGFQLEIADSPTELKTTTTLPYGCSLVHTWYDQSGNNRHLTPPSVGQRPFCSVTGYQLIHNNRPYIAFAPSRTLYRDVSLSPTADYLITVGSRGTTGSGRGYFNIFNTDGGGLENAVNSYMNWRRNDTAAGNNPPVLNTTHLHSGSWDGTNSYTYRDGDLKYTTNTPLTSSVSRFWVSNGRVAGRPIDANIHELIYYATNQYSNRLGLESLVGQYYNIDVKPTVSHPEAQDWINRVYTNNGTVSFLVASIVNKFCQDVDAAGLRNKFYRLNLFTGSNLNAALVPLYLGDIPFGTTYGNSTDTNVAFISSDYSLNRGLPGNASTKYIRTVPLPTIKLDWSTHSIGLDLANAFTSSTQYGHCGVFFNEGSPTPPRGRLWISGNNTFPGGQSLHVGINTYTSSPNLKVVNRASATDMRLFEDGVQKGSTQITSAAAYNQMPEGDFCVLARSYQNVSGGVPTTIVYGDAKSNATARGYFIGETMTPEQHAIFALIWRNARNSMGRP
jgi:hypothetical protein